MGNAQRKAAHHPSKGPYVPSSSAKKVHWDGPGLPAPPGKPILIPGEEDAQPDVVGIRWERSPSNGGSAIIGYHVEHRKMGSPHWVRSAPVLCTFPELTLSGLEPGWRYQFRIRAQNALGLSEPSELSDPLSVTLQRTASSAPRFDLDLRDCVALEGEQAEFEVIYAGTPLPKVSWFKDGFEIFSSRRTMITTDSGKSVLIIQRTSIDDEGEIKCSATNRAGHISTRAKLMIEAPPHVRLPRQYEDGLLFEQGETIRLKATNGGRPPPSITWYHNGEIIIVDQRHNFESITDNETILKIQDAKRQDRGEYTIRAINKLGEDVASFLVTVTDRPAAPGKTIVTSTLGRSVTLAWKEPDDDGGCKIGTYIIEYYRIGWDVWLKAVTCRQITATLNDLIEGSEYRFRVKAENPYGVSDPSEESDIIFIPDPKRGITEPNMRAKSASHRDIPRGRSERREVSFNEPAQRTRSLTREEASHREAMSAYERTASSQRLLASAQQQPQPPPRPSRADSRVTFALDTTSREKDEPKRQWSKELLPQPGELAILARGTSQQTAVVITPSFDDSGGRHRSFIESRSRSVSFSRDHSPSPLELEETTEIAIKERVESMTLRGQLSPPRTPRRRRSSGEIRDANNSLRTLRREDEETMLHGSSEFMLVLYPGEEDGQQHEASRIEKAAEAMRRDSREARNNQSVKQQSAVQVPEESEEEDLVPPPMSISLPELFSADHQVVEIFREAVSSTELLHERAMERFYKAVEAEKSQTKSQPKDVNNLKPPGEGEGYPLFSGRTRSVRRRLSNSGANATTWQLKRDRRRSSEGQAKVELLKTPQVPTVGMPLQNVSSDPNLPTSDEMLAQKNPEPWGLGGGLGDSAERLRRWHEPGMDLSNENSIAEMINKENFQNKQKDELLKLPDLNIREPMKVEEEYDEVAPDTGELLADDSIETSGVSSESESTDSEDLKQLKARIMAIPVVDEEDTYNPRGRMVVHSEHDVPPPVPPHRVPVVDVSPPIPDRRSMSPTNLTPASSNSAIVPKSILKKRTETEPVPTNQFGRPIPPEKPIRKSLPAYDDIGMDVASSKSLSNLDFTDETATLETTTAVPTSTPSLTTLSTTTAAPTPVTTTPTATAAPTVTTTPTTITSTTDADREKEAVISAGEAAVTKRRQMRQGSKTLSIEDAEEIKEEKMAVVSHYTEIVRQYSHPEFRQRSLSRDREQQQRRYTESPSESRVMSPVPSQPLTSNIHKERLPITPGKVITPIPPSVPLMGVPAKIITPIPPVLPTTPIKKAKPIDPSEQKARRGSLTNRSNEEASVSRGRSRKQEPTNEMTRRPGKSSVSDSRSSTPTRRPESRPQSRNESPMPRSRNVSRDRAPSVAGSRSSSTTRGGESRPSTGRQQTRGSSRPSSRSNSKDRSRANTPTAEKIERLQRALDGKNNRLRRASTKDETKQKEEKEKSTMLTIAAEKKVRNVFDYVMDVGLLLAALYVYLFKKEVLAIPIIALLLYRYIQQEISEWMPTWLKRR
ncbi:titin homolog isoform X2 [Nasonia vitripennis]|uniref:Titin n=1 Tax=Nasonia vitripennis TaxID=7425 RepID=A0A7M7QQY0_NASVI|nr:titin homolog isoform X2 [Nasonia vitripennis]